MNETKESKVTQGTAPPRRITATEMRRLPREECRRIFAGQAALAEVLYRDHPELSDLGDLALKVFDHDDTPATP